MRRRQPGSIIEEDVMSAGQSRRSLARRGFLAAICAGLAGCAIFQERVVPVEPNPAQFGRDYPEEFPAAGREIARDHCASCHAIDSGAASPVRNAPPFNTLLQKYDPDLLTDRLLAGISVSHSRMPTFDFNVIAADSLVAYLETIQVRK